jgi:hypothetical protein
MERTESGDLWMVAELTAPAHVVAQDCDRAAGRWAIPARP